ncbi:sulfotransferase family protein [Parvularcula marina]|uniref:Sulfotransferase family protein n=2 Tax=Parvularcula marina TaxID=2292771 RepID=A0A371RFV0_9PROT|nr:sulfotransferase family protein [Parvularcula marina]
MLGRLAMTAKLDEMAERAANALRAGRLAEAEETLRALLAEDPRHIDGLQLMGLLAQERGNPQEAEKYLKSAIALDTNFWPARINLAGLYLKAGAAAPALEEARIAARLAPDQPLALRHLADAAERTKQFGEGFQALERLSAMGAADVTIEMRAALHGIMANEFDGARLALDRARGKGAPLQSLHPIAAELAIAAGKWDDLQKVATAWHQAEPQNTKARRYASRAELELGNIEEAADLFRPLIEEQASPDADDKLMYGRICLNAQRFDEAGKYLTEAARQLPKSADALTSLARLKTFEGELDEAQRLCEAAISADPESVRSYLQLVIVTRGQIDPPYKEKMATLLRAGVADQGLEAGLAFALGDVAFRERKAEDALDFYRQGNERRAAEGAARGYPYDSKVMEKDVTLLEEAGALLEGVDLGEADGPVPIFITGMPRSGTTLIERIIASHGQVSPLGERVVGPKLLEKYLYKIRESGAEASVGWLKENADDLRREYLTGTGDIGTEYFTDKMPGNALAIPLFAALFPKARFLLTTRVPFDVAVSVFRHQFPFPYSWSHRFEDIAHYYPVYMGASARFVRARPDTAAIFDYDGLAADPAGQIPELIAKAGLDWDEACADASSSGNRIATFSSVQVRGEISPKSSDGGSLFRSLMEGYASELDVAVAAALQG